ncbi:hypothetical protein MIND_01424800 [Mycena indigotica]|uniref:Uncharacterized protein n=1 Tax=Mycena indigotica TaxID=2126181 RepID=A0A8H6VUK3_9AGAR|nr:uncharacterized protein MIND_01424800 [Mycena indigotica]KAF7288789.1 hypothetical protein MIND_01424800 [Mycena indigotica]
MLSAIHPAALFPVYSPHTLPEAYRACTIRSLHPISPVLRLLPRILHGTTLDRNYLQIVARGRGSGYGKSCAWNLHSSSSFSRKRPTHQI